MQPQIGAVLRCPRLVLEPVRCDHHVEALTAEVLLEVEEVQVSQAIRVLLGHLGRRQAVLAGPAGAGAADELERRENWGPGGR